MSEIKSFIDEQFEDMIVERLQTLDMKVNNRRVPVDYLEGRGLMFTKLNEIIRQYKAVPAVLVGTGDINPVQAMDVTKTLYKSRFRLHVLIQAYEEKRESGSFSAIKNLRRTIRREIIGNNPYNANFDKVVLDFISDNALIIIDNVTIYEQIYEGIFTDRGIAS